MTISIEICVEGLESAVAAQAGGAQRVELCDNLIQGGTTPSIGMIEAVREALEIELMVIIRPRAGDFLYTEQEYAVMQRDIQRLQGLGVDGVVLGLLNRDGSIDQGRSARLMELARPMSVTYHRAFDMSRDPFEALNVLLKLGVERILTSGQAPNALAGIDLIRKLQARAADRAEIMPGGGVNIDNALRFVQEANVRELHVGSGVKSSVQSEMIFRNSKVMMGGDGERSEFEWSRVDVKKVKGLVEVVRRKTR